MTVYWGGLTNEFTVGLVADAADGSSAFLEIGPALVMSLGLVEINSLGALVHLVEPKFVVCALVLEDVESNATRFLARLNGVVFDHLEEFLHAVFLDFGFDDD